MCNVEGVSLDPADPFKVALSIFYEDGTYETVDWEDKATTRG